MLWQCIVDAGRTYDDVTLGVTAQPVACQRDGDSDKRRCLFWQTIVAIETSPNVIIMAVFRLYAADNNSQIIFELSQIRVHDMQSAS